MQEFDHLYISYSTQPNVFNKFNSYMKNSKLFVSMRGPLNLQAFKELMHAQKYIFVDSEAIRAEYTYFVCFQMLPEHAAYFNRPTFQSQATESVRDTMRSAYSSQYEGGNTRGEPRRKRAIDAARETLSQYEEESARNTKGKRGQQTTKGGPNNRGSRYDRQTEDSIA